MAQTTVIREMAARFGLHETDAGGLEGVWNGRAPITLRYDLVATGTDPMGLTTVTFPIEPSLRMGLDVRRDPYTIGAMFHRDEFTLGEERYDRNALISAADPELARRVFSRLERKLDPVAYARIRVTDGSVVASMWGTRPGLEEVEIWVDSTCDLAQALLAARAEELASWEPGLVEGWSKVAERRGLDFERRASSMRGRVGRTDLVAFTDYRGELCTSVRVRLPQEVPASLVLAPQKLGYVGHLLRLGDDIRLGDQRFDSVFTVNGTPEEAVRAILDEANRAFLLSIRARFGAIEIREGHLDVRARGPLPREEDIDALIELSVDAAHRLAPAGPTQGAFR